MNVAIGRHSVADSSSDDRSALIALTAEAMEILDPGNDLMGWHGAHPGWTETNVYPPIGLQREAAI
jgi:hypothetical protein